MINDKYIPYSEVSELKKAIEEHGSFVQKKEFSPIIETFKIKEYVVDEDKVFLTVTLEREGNISSLDLLEDYEFLDGAACGYEDKYQKVFVEVLDKLDAYMKARKNKGNKC